MNRVTITLTIDLPDGVVPDVEYGGAVATKPGAPGPLQQALTAMPDGMSATYVSDEPPWPAETIPALAQQVFPDAKLDPDQRPVAVQAAANPACPAHQREMVFRPAGVSKSKVGPDGKPKAYPAFWTCPERDCKQTRDAA